MIDNRIKIIKSDNRCLYSPDNWRRVAIQVCNELKK